MEREEPQSITAKAKAFAIKNHGEQKRKFSDVPYVSHPIGVAERMEQLNLPEEVIVAAFLHDILEDTSITYGEIVTEFSPVIADLVQELTSDKNEAKRLGKAEYLVVKINNLSPLAQVLKLADRENNVKDLHQSAPAFSKRYARETQYILANLTFEPTQAETEIIQSIRDKIRNFLW